MRQVKNSHRQTDRQADRQTFLYSSLVPWRDTITIIVFNSKTTICPSPLATLFKSFRSSLSTVFLTLSPTPDNRALSLTPGWIVIHSKSTIRCLLLLLLLFLPFCFPPVSTKNCQKIAFYYYYYYHFKIIVLERHDSNNRCLKQWL